MTHHSRPRFGRPSNFALVACLAVASVSTAGLLGACSTSASPSYVPPSTGGAGGTGDSNGGLPSGPGLGGAGGGAGAAGSSGAAGAAGAAGSGGAAGAGGSGPVSDAGVPEPVTRPDESAAPRAGVLDCRNGKEPAWATSYGSVPSFNACMGTLSFAFGNLVMNTGAAAGPVSGMGASAPPGADRLESGPGCALADEMTLVLNETEKVVTILHGHDQAKYGWTTLASGGAGFWAPEPYLYEDLVAIGRGAGGAEERLSESTDSVENFKKATKWLLIQRDGSYAVFSKDDPASTMDTVVWRVSESGDGLASMEKRIAGPNGPMFPPRGRVTEYRRTNGYLEEIRDYRQPTIISRVFERDATTHAVKSITVDAEGVGGPFQEKTNYEYFDSSDAANVGRLKKYGAEGRKLAEIGYQAAPGLPPLPNLLTSPSDDITKYEYRADGRLKKIIHAAVSSHPEEDKHLTFTYKACGGGDLADGAATFPYATRPFACTVSEKDEDGFGRATSFTKFGGDAVPQTRVYTAGVWDHSQDKVVTGTEYKTLRNQAGYRLGTRVATTGVTERFRPSDGRPAGRCVATRHGGPGDDSPLDADLQASADAGVADSGASIGSASVSDVRYAVRCYDSDNMLVREVTADGETETTYQKTGHPPTDTAFWNTIGWASQIPYDIVERHKNPKGAVVSRTTQKRVVLGAASSGNAEGVFTIHEATTFGGGTSSIVFDKFLRPVANIAPGNVGWNTREYDTRGREWKTNDPTAQIATVTNRRPSGTTSTSSTSVCGKEKTNLSTDEDPQLFLVKSSEAKTVRENGAPLVTKTTHELEPVTGRIKKTTVEYSGFKQETVNTFASTGNVILGTQVTTSTPAAGVTDTRTDRIRLRGYDFAAQ
ncbi:MAG: hypothetical protein U0169_04080 [Polyangiaceae bacterium]